MSEIASRVKAIIVDKLGVDETKLLKLPLSLPTLALTALIP